MHAVRTRGSLSVLSELSLSPSCPQQAQLLTLSARMHGDKRCTKYACSRIADG